MIKVKSHIHADQGNHLMGKANAHPPPQHWLGQTRLKRCSCQANFWSGRHNHIVSDTLFTKWKVNLNCISTGSPCGEDVSLSIVWSTGWPSHDQPPLSAHKSHFMPATLLKRQNKSPISTAAALAHCADKHREISGTKQSGTLQHPKLCSGAPCCIKLRVCPTSYSRGNFLLLPPEGQQRHQ